MNDDFDIRGYLARKAADMIFTGGFMLLSSSWTSATFSEVVYLMLLTCPTNVRRYNSFIVVETTGDKLSGSTGFNDVAGYICGKNSKEKIPVTTPVFTQLFDPDMSTISIQIILPLEKRFDRVSLLNTIVSENGNGLLIFLPEPSQEAINLRKVEGGIAAVVKFSGKPTEEIVREKEKALRAALARDGLKPKLGHLLARYNDPGGTWSFVMRNEVLIWLEEFSAD
ncbi:SOUL hem-binding protein [Dillenia turbinata]|uniref:SOUL hem-binding protein n=1 Tax=Dillenia turbinata TaxID=194707 RepID=A0AAN8ZP83_9MAGN